MLRFITSLVVLVATSSLFAQAPWSYYTPEQEKAIRAKLPVFEDKVLQRRLDKAVLYDSTVLPGMFFDTRLAQSKDSAKAYKDEIDLVRLDFNLSISAEDPIGNPNNEEPWKNTAGAAAYDKAAVHYFGEFAKTNVEISRLKTAKSADLR